MSEINDGQEPDLSTDFRNIIESQVGGSCLSLIKFDELRGALYNSLAELPHRMREMNHGSKGEEVDVQGFGESIGELLTDMVEHDPTPDNIVETATLLMKSDSDERIDLMRKLLEGENSLRKFDNAQLKQLIGGIVSDSDSVSQAIESIAGLYGYDLKNDVTLFIQHLVLAYSHDGLNDNEISHGGTLEIRKDLKDHALDVAKIVAGVTLALTVDRLLRRRRG